MAVFNFESGKALLLLREMHLPSWTNSRATFLPQIRDLPVSTGFSCCDFAKFSQNPLRKPNSWFDIAGTLRKPLFRDGPSPAIVVGDDIHWQIILTDARSQTVAFIDPFGSGFLQDIIAAIQNVLRQWTTRKVAVQTVDYKIATEGRRMELWCMGNVGTGEVAAALEPKWGDKHL